MFTIKWSLKEQKQKKYQKMLYFQIKPVSFSATISN